MLLIALVAARDKGSGKTTCSPEFLPCKGACAGLMGAFQAKFEEHALHTRLVKLLRQTGKKHEELLRLAKN